MNNDLQDAIYAAAKADDRKQLGALLKQLILPQKPESDRGAYSVTIDLAAGQMSTLSLLVLSLQGSATGLFRYLAEKHPDDIKRMAPNLVEATGNMLFVGPLSDLGVAPENFGPLGQQALQDLRQPDISSENLRRVKESARKFKLGL